MNNKESYISIFKEMNDKLQDIETKLKKVKDDIKISECKLNIYDMMPKPDYGDLKTFVEDEIKKENRILEDFNKDLIKIEMEKVLATQIKNIAENWSK